MKKLATFLILIAAGAGGWYWWSSTRPVERPEVVKAVVSRGDVTEAVRATGTIEAIRTVQIGSQVSGIVKEIYADFNDIVSAGQLLAELDPSLFEVQVRIQEANIEQRKTDIENQKVQLADAERNLQRARDLFAKGLTNEQQVEQADLAVKNRNAQIASAEKQLVSAEANLQNAELNLAYTKIYSPIDGVIVNRVVDEGQAVQSSMNVAQFFTIATDLRDLRLRGGVDEAEIGKVRPGQTVEFRVDAYANDVFTGTVESVQLNATVQQNVVTYPVWISVRNPDLKLRPSLTASLDIIISRSIDVLRVPNTAIRFRPTNDMYVALGLTAPTPGQGRAGGSPGRANGNANRPDDPQGGRAGGGAAAEAGRGGSEPGPAGTRGGFGADGALTPEQARQLAERFGGTGGRGGRRGGAGAAALGGAGGRGANQRPDNVGQPMQIGSGRIDQYFTPVQPTRSRGTVWIWNEEGKELRQVNLTLGVTDGQVSELISGDLEVGQELVTGIILPVSMTRPTTQTNPFQQQGGRGMPGMGGPGRGGRG